MFHKFKEEKDSSRSYTREYGCTLSGTSRHSQTVTAVSGHLAALILFRRAALNVGVANKFIPAADEPRSTHQFETVVASEPYHIEQAPD